MHPNPAPRPTPVRPAAPGLAWVLPTGNRSDSDTLSEGLRLAAAIVLPVVALGFQWILWPWIRPFGWFFFFPTVFFSARLGSFRGGLISTALSVVIVWYFFLPPQLSWKVDNPSNLWSILIFVLVGYLISQTQARLERANHATVEALAQARAANEKITHLYDKTRELDEL